MEMILGVIEDLLDKLNSGNPDNVADAKASLRNNKTQFIANLEELANAGNADATKILDKLKNIQLD